MALKVLFFDFGGTLDLYPVVHDDCIKTSHHMLEILAEIGIDLRDRYSGEEFYHFIKNRTEEYRRWKSETLIELPEMDVWKGYILYDESKKDRLDGRTVEELTYLIDNGFHTRQLRNETAEALEKLKEFNLTMGIISNVLSASQVPRDLVKYGIEGYFDPVITSAAFGRIKPHSSIFIHAAERAGVRPDECIHIGNSPLKDVMGASKSGFLATVQIVYEMTPPAEYNTHTAPDYLIRSLLELPEIVSTLVSA